MGPYFPQKNISLGFQRPVLVGRVRRRSRFLLLKVLTKKYSQSRLNWKPNARVYSQGSWKETHPTISRRMAKKVLQWTDLSSLFWPRAPTDFLSGNFKNILKASNEHMPFLSHYLVVSIKSHSTFFNCPKVTKKWVSISRDKKVSVKCLKTAPQKMCSGNSFPCDIKSRKKCVHFIF